MDNAVHNMRVFSFLRDARYAHPTHDEHVDFCTIPCYMRLCITSRDLFLTNENSQSVTVV